MSFDSIIDPSPTLTHTGVSPVAAPLDPARSIKPLYEDTVLFICLMILLLMVLVMTMVMIRLMLDSMLMMRFIVPVNLSIYYGASRVRVSSCGDPQSRDFIHSTSSHARTPVTRPPVTRAFRVGPAPWGQSFPGQSLGFAPESFSTRMCAFRVGLGLWAQQSRPTA